MNIIQENNRVITTKKGKGKLPIFCGNVEWLILVYARHRNLQKGLHSGSCLPLYGWTHHHTTAVVVPKLHKFNLQPSNLHIYHLRPSITSDKNLIRAFMDVVKNISTLRACAYKYNVHSRTIKNLLDKYESYQISITRQEK